LLDYQRNKEPEDLPNRSDLHIVSTTGSVKK
jgi:hypothetical protein